MYDPPCLCKGLRADVEQLHKCIRPLYTHIFPYPLDDGAGLFVHRNDFPTKETRNVEIAISSKIEAVGAVQDSSLDKFFLGVAIAIDWIIVFVTS